MIMQSLSPQIQLENLTNYFGPMTSEQALNEAIRLEQECMHFGINDPGRAYLKRDMNAALLYAELLGTKEKA